MQSERLYSNDPSCEKKWQGTYEYYTFPGGKKYTTKCVFNQYPPKEITLYIDEKKPHKAHTEHTLRYGRGPVWGTIPFLGGVVLFVILVRAFGSAMGL